MSADALLTNPAFFSNIEVHPCDLVIEYLNLCQIYKTKSMYINAHVFGTFFCCCC